MKRISKFWYIFCIAIYVSIGIAIVFFYINSTDFKDSILYASQNTKINNYVEEGKLDQAIEYINEQIKLHPKDYYFYSKKGYYLVDTGKNNEAIECLNQALKLNPKDDASLNNLSWVYYNMGKYNEALEYSIKALKIDPNDPTTTLNKANALEALGKYDDAIKEYDKVIRLKSNEYLAYYGKALAYFDDGKYKESEELFIKYNQLCPKDFDSYMYLGQCLSKQDKDDAAIKAFEEAADLSTERPEPYVYIGNTLAKTEKYEEAKTSYDRAIKLDPKYTDAYIYKGVAFYYENRFKEAEVYFDKAIKLEPDYSSSYEWMAKNYLKQNEYQKSIELCKKALSLDSKSSFAYNVEALALYNQGEYNEALHLSKRAIEYDGDYKEAYLTQIAIQFDQRNFLDCIDTIDILLTVSPSSDDFNALWYAGDCYYNLAEHDKAVEYYEKALKIEPENVEVLASLGWEYLYIENYQKAQEICSKALKIDGKNYRAAGLKKKLEELKLPEGRRIAEFIRQNYLYSSETGGLNQKLNEFSNKKNVTPEDINGLLKSIKAKNDKFTFFVYDKIYDAFLKEEENTHLTERDLGSGAYYIQFYSFTPEIGSEFKRAIDDIDSPENKTLVIDLRNNPGGSIDCANDILDFLLPKCESSRLVFKNGSINAFYSDSEQIKFKKIIVMVNENSASSSELLTLGLKKNLKNVVVIGHTTFGKGVGQITFEEKNKKYLLYLTSFNWDVKKTSIANKGITPDIKIKSSFDSDYFAEVNRQAAN